MVAMSSRARLANVVKRTFFRGLMPFGQAVEEYSSHRDMIVAGGYNCLRGHALIPEKIEGQPFEPLASETRLVHPAVQTVTEEVHRAYGYRMASLSDFLRFGIKNPDVQRGVPVVICWVVDEQCWSAHLYGGPYSRTLAIGPEPKDFPWLADYRILLKAGSL